ncbi:hypothetical protein RHOSPDRAFT_34403 [Rhodotorula sp. JG-1b]|nr:hypothetical protein RHOSPDRAFT_34403 [Rhodotorula sp. JG-1b]
MPPTPEVIYLEDSDSDQASSPGAPPSHHENPEPVKTQSDSKAHSLAVEKEASSSESESDVSDREDDTPVELVEDEDKPDSKNLERSDEALTHTRPTGRSIVAGPPTARASSPSGDSLRVQDADADTVAVQPRDLESERARLLASFKELCEGLKRSEIERRLRIIKLWKRWFVTKSRKTYILRNEVFYKASKWSSRSFATDYTQAIVPEKVFELSPPDLRRFTFLDLAIFEMLSRDGEHLRQWQRFIAEPLDQIVHLDPWLLKNRSSMLNYKGPGLYAFAIGKGKEKKKTYIGSGEVICNRGTKHASASEEEHDDGPVQRGKSVSMLVRLSFLEADTCIAEELECVLYKAPKKMERTHLFTLESVTLPTYGALQEMGGMNTNLLDGCGHASRISLSHLRQGLTRLFDYLAPKNGNLRQARSSLPAFALHKTDIDLMRSWAALNAEAGWQLSPRTLMCILYGLCHVDPVADVIAKEGVPPQIWRTGAFPPKLAAALRRATEPDAAAAADADSDDSDDDTKLGSDGSAPSAATRLERARASYEKRKKELAPAAFRLAPHCDPSRPRQIGSLNSLDRSYGGNDASGSSNAGTSSSAGNVPSGSVPVPRVQQAPTIHNPNFYRAQTTKARKRKGRDTKEGF